MSRPLPPAEYAARRITVLQAHERGISRNAAARLAGVSTASAGAWVRQHATGEVTLAMLLDGEVPSGGAPGVTKTNISPFAPTGSLRELVDRIRAGSSQAQSAEQLLYLTAPYVLHPDAPVDHLAAWVRFAVTEVLDNDDSSWKSESSI